MLLTVPVGAFYLAQEPVDETAFAVAGAPAAPTFAAPVQVVNTYGFEPSVRVAEDGTVYVAFARAFPNPSWLYYSHDNGESWVRAPRPPVPVGAEPEIDLAADGTLYYTDLYLGNVVTAWYTNRGQTLGGWAAVGEASAVVDRQWITVGAPSATGGHEMWLNTNDVGRGVMQYYTPDAKLVPPAKAAPIVIGGGPSYPPTYDPVNKFAYTIYEATGVFVARTNGLQAAPTRYSVDSSSTGIANVFPSVAVDDAGTVYGVWSSEKDGAFSIFLAWSTDKGATWNGPVRVTDGTGTHVFPWVDAGAPGRVAIAWYGTDDATANPHNVPQDAEWQIRFAQSVDVLTGSPTFAVAQATGTVHTGSICVGGISCDPPAGNVDRDLGDYLQIAVGPDGMAHIAYTDDVVHPEGRIYHVKQIGGTPS